MKRITLKQLLPIALLTFALACHVYDTHEYRLGAYRDRAVNNIEYFSQHSPALAKRISLGINFPALVLSYPLRNAYDPVLYSRNTEYTYFAIYPRDIGFFVGIVIFWYLVGRVLDERQAQNKEIKSSPRLRRAASSVGIVFGILSALYADQFIKTAWLPQRQIGLFGFAWAAGLLAYFLWQFTSELGARRDSKQMLFAVMLTVFLTAALWIGEPFASPSATQLFPVFQ